MLGSGQQPNGPVTHYQKHYSKADHVLCVPNETKSTSGGRLTKLLRRHQHVIAFPMTPRLGSRPHGRFEQQLASETENGVASLLA
jgi:hypothetical protein